IKEYFANYFLHMSDVTFDMSNNQMQIHKQNTEPWKVTLVDTGPDSMTGGRLRRVREYLKNDESFCFTYGDGVADIDISALISAHQEKGRLATVTAVQPPGRYGALEINGDSVTSFAEKPMGDGAWINGGFFVLSPKVIDRIEGDVTVWEQEPLMSLAEDGELSVFHHNGFWQPMDTLRERNQLEEQWQSGKAPWKIW
nr:glucose-1-phosphate cytidylyltransferase [Rhizobiaceae bacterium]